MSSVPHFADAALDAIPNCSDAQWADARRLVLRECPELASMILGARA